MYILYAVYDPRIPFCIAPPPEYKNSKYLFFMVHSGKGNWKTVMMYLIPVLVFSVLFKLPIFWEFYSEWCDVQCLNDKPVDKPKCESIHPRAVSTQDSWEDISDNGKFI